MFIEPRVSAVSGSVVRFACVFFLLTFRSVERGSLASLWIFASLHSGLAGELLFLFRACESSGSSLGGQEDS